MSHHHSLFEVSWEVCNKVGGIHTVVATKAKTLVGRYGDDYVCVGPWLLGNPETERTFESTRGYESFEEACRQLGYPVRVGRWKIPGRPLTVLVSFSGLFEQKDRILAALWEQFKVDSLFGAWDYVEPVLFGYAAGQVVDRWCAEFLGGQHGRAVAQFHEWMTCPGLLYLENKAPEIGTIFTTHATVVGRALSARGRSPEEGLAGRAPDDVAVELGVRSKHSLENVSANNADVFTTVSEITAREAKLLFGRDAQPLLPNGIDVDVIDELAAGFPRETAERRLREFARRFLGEDLSDALLVCLSGRYEFHNKGIDILLDACAHLDHRPGRRIVVFLMVPAANSGICKSVAERLRMPLEEIRTPLGISTHNLNDREGDPIQQTTRRLGLHNQLDQRVKVVHTPIYFNGADGLLDMPYEAVLRAMDLSAFPSFYEPWGYTPEESLAVGVPTITSDYAGFGRWARSVGLEPEDGVVVLERVGVDDATAAERLAALIDRFAVEPADRAEMSAVCRRTAQRTAWTDLIRNYYEAIDRALASTQKRVPKAPTGRPRLSVPVAPAPEGKRPRLSSFQVSATLPKELAGLERLARNYWWSWDPEARELFRTVSPQSWEAAVHNPIAFLRSVFPTDLAARAADPQFLERQRRVLARFDAYLQSSGTTRHSAGLSPRHPIAYFSAEFGLHESLPIYSGGLGILAGDHLKSASDLDLPLVGVGLFYRRGYLRQKFSGTGEQLALPEDNDPRNLPLEAVLDEQGQPLEIQLELPTSTLVLRAWLVRVGRVNLYLLDSELEKNRPEDRSITHQLYGGDHEHRLRQELVLGRGGERLLARLGIQPSVWHINEGHAAFLALERIGRMIREQGLTFEEAWELARATSAFTTHTPVPAGHDRFAEDLMRRYFSDAPAWLGISWERFIALGWTEEDKSTFNMTYLALRCSAVVNGVSKLHGEVSKSLLHACWPQYLRAEVPIIAITNGIHLPTWTHPDVARLLGAADRPVVAADFAREARSIAPEALWDVRKRARARLMTAVRESLERDFLDRGDSPRLLSSMLSGLDEGALLIGFARRFAPYKRASLLFSDLERLARVLSAEERPVRVIFAGKAHPRDALGLEVLKRIFDSARTSPLLGKVFLLEDYDVDLARTLVQGVDVWLNNPIRMLEASGTSGMKAAANGALNLSIADGWWVEAADGHNGWVIGDERLQVSSGLQDELDASSLYHLLEEEVVPLFFERDATGLPRRWLERVAHAFETIPTVFNTDRMVGDYRDHAYAPLAGNFAELTADRMRRLRELAADHARVRKGFAEVRFLTVKVADLSGLAVGDPIEVHAEVALGPLSPEDLVVELVLGHTRAAADLRNVVVVPLAPQGAAREQVVAYEGAHRLARSGTFGYGVRVRARERGALDRSLGELVLWA